MLALYDKMMKAPDDLTTAPPIYIEKTQTPLALIQMSDEEMVSIESTSAMFWFWFWLHVTCCLISTSLFRGSVCGSEELTVMLS